jgi:molybdopterin synthase catalytic subunit/MOSC domain-containing protein YiiM
MPSHIQFSLSSEPISAAVLAESLSDPAAGALVHFEGRVRNHNAGKIVDHLEYQAYPALAEATGQRILMEESAKHGLLRARAAHRTGRLAIGEAAVWVGVASAHRGAAFDAARSIMERLKYELPVWKKETYADGRCEWVGPDRRSPETGADERPAAEEWQARLEAIFISPGHDFRGRHGLGREEHPVASVAEVECVAGLGLRGDRYFGHKPDFKGQVTFFDAAVVDRIRREFSRPDLPAEAFRRNLIVRGVALADWVGRRFRFQGVEFEGSEECKPCYWMDQAVAPGVEEALIGGCRGGLRARILSDGVLRVTTAAPAVPDAHQ